MKELSSNINKKTTVLIIVIRPLYTPSALLFTVNCTVHKKMWDFHVNFGLIRGADKDNLLIGLKVVRGLLLKMGT